MINGDRKPTAPPMESREPKSIRFTPTEWEALADGARQRGLEPAVFARMLTMYALIIVQAPTFAEASAWIAGLSPKVLGAPHPRAAESQVAKVRAWGI